MIFKPFSSFVRSEGILEPAPISAFLLPFHVALQPDAADHAASRNKLTASGEFGHVFHGQLRQVVVFIGKVTGCPHQAGRRRFRLSLIAQFGFPMDALLVYDFELGSGAFFVFFYERELSGRLVLFCRRGRRGG